MTLTSLESVSHKRLIHIFLCFNQLFGIIEVKSYRLSYQRAAFQIDHNLTRLRQGLKVGEREWPPDRLWFRRPTALLRNRHHAARERNEIGRRWRHLNRWYIGRSDCRRRTGCAAARHGAYHLARRKGGAGLEVVIHQVQRLIEIHVQRDQPGVEAGEGVERIEVMRVLHFDVTGLAVAPLGDLIQTEIRARRVIRRDDGIVTSVNDNRRLREGPERAHLVNTGLNARVVIIHRAGDRVLAGRQDMQAQRAVEGDVLAVSRGRDRRTFVLRAADRRVVDQVDAGGGRDAAAQGEDLLDVVDRSWRGVAGAIGRAVTEAAESILDAEATIGVA